MRSILAAALLLTACATTTNVLPPSPSSAPQIRFPKNGQHIGQSGDAACPNPEQACYKIRAEGTIGAAATPFFAVQPVMATPQMWIQPLIPAARADGSFSSLIYLGEPAVGAGQYFKVYLFACKDADRFREGDVLRQLPTDCQVSEPVEIFRER